MVTSGAQRRVSSDGQRCRDSHDLISKAMHTELPGKGLG